MRDGGKIRQFQHRLVVFPVADGCGFYKAQRLLDHLHAAALADTIRHQFQIESIALHRIKALRVLLLDIGAHCRDLFRRYNQHHLVPALGALLLRVHPAAALAHIHIAALCHALNRFVTPADHPVVVRLHQHGADLVKALEQRKNKVPHALRQLRTEQDGVILRRIDVPAVDGDDGGDDLQLRQNLRQRAFGPPGTQGKGASQGDEAVDGLDVVLWDLGQLGQGSVDVRDQQHPFKNLSALHWTNPPLVAGFSKMM